MTKPNNGAIGSMQSAGTQAPGIKTHEIPANGAIWEREAFEAWAKDRFPTKLLSTQSDSRAMDEAREFAREGWDARAALTAEKVAAEPEPEPMVVPERLPGEKFSEWAKRTYESQPAQSVQAEPVVSRSCD